MRAATYARLSDGGLSIPDQEKTARKYAEDRGWQVVAEFKAEHSSAVRKIERKDFEALLQAASDGTRQLASQWLLGIGTRNRSCGFGHRPVECRVEQRLSRPGHKVNCFVSGELSDIG